MKGSRKFIQVANNINPVNIPIVISQLTLRNDPIKLDPITVPNLPKIRMIHTAIVLWIVGNNKTAVPVTTDIIGPPNDIKAENITKIRKGCVIQNNDNPQRPDADKNIPLKD